MEQNPIFAGWMGFQVRSNSSKLLILLIDAEWSPGTLPGLHLHSCSETKREVIDLCFPWWQFQEEGELPHLLKRVEKYPRACVRWLWGTRAFVLVYDPDYMKMVLGRSGERETLSWRQSFIWVHVPGCEIPQETDTSDIKAWTPPNTLPTTSETRVSLLCLTLYKWIEMIPELEDDSLSTLI